MTWVKNQGDLNHAVCLFKSFNASRTEDSFVLIVTVLKQLLEMKLSILKNKTICEIQKEFNNQYPFLKLEFYKPGIDGLIPLKKHLGHSIMLESAGLKNTGELGIENEMTVAELEKSFLNRFGLNVQVSRKSGILWLETTMTDKWSLEKQNEHGREISLPVKKEVLERDDQDN